MAFLLSVSLSSFLALSRALWAGLGGFVCVMYGLVVVVFMISCLLFVTLHGSESELFLWSDSHSLLLYKRW